jgi:hypothetical protein
MSEEIENVVLERILRRQEKANEEILKEIGKVLGEIGELSPSEVYTIGQQLKYGESLDKIVKILSDTSKISEVEIYKMLEAEARKNLELKRVYFEAKKLDFIPYEKNIALQNKVREIAIATVGTYKNISRTTGLTFLDLDGNKVTRGIRESYRKIVDDAIFNVSTGKETFYEALKRQLETIGQAGVQSIEYESGRHRRLDSALRMNLSEGLNQLAIAQQEIVGEQFGYNMVQVTHHENAAPDHIDTIDGKQFVKLDIIRQQIASGEEKEIKLKDIKENGLTFKGKWYYDFDYINDNLDRPTGTLNCRHVAYTAILGVDRPLYTEEQLRKDKEANERGFEFEGKHFTNYEGTQLLRKIELELRKTRETKLLAKSANDKDLLSQIRQKENALVSKYYDILKASGLKSKIERARVLTK